MLLGKTFQMVYLKCVSCNRNCILVEKRKNTFHRLLTFNIAYKLHFLLGKNVGGTRHPCEKNEPTLDYSGGGGCTVRPTGS